MPLSPELKLLPEIASRFFASGLAGQIAWSVITGDTERNLSGDAERLVAEFKKCQRVMITGLGNINGGCFIAFNHPNMDILMPGILELIVQVRKQQNRNVGLVMASEIMLFAKLNDKKAVPGSIKFMERFHRMYGGKIISSPTVIDRKDYLNGRAIALRQIFKSLKEGGVIALSPEGHIEENDEVSPIETFHEGSGAIAKLASKLGIPVVPVGFWATKKKTKIHIDIGQKFFVKNESDTEATIEVMKHVATLLPNFLRGPFRK